jgi:hypothetical protein
MGGAARDLGYFGPDSISWQVHREVTVLFGGARAVLMQAAHPLVIAGARETRFYERNPWRRLQRTLLLTYTLTFGTKAEADAAAKQINDVHARIKGVDEVTGLPFDALDPDLLLYVHACLIESALLFERLTIGRRVPATGRGLRAPARRRGGAIGGRAVPRPAEGGGVASGAEGGFAARVRNVAADAPPALRGRGHSRAPFGDARDVRGAARPASAPATAISIHRALPGVAASRTRPSRG